jgi:hypothetical protein
MIKLYMDDWRECPEGWLLARTVDQAKWYILNADVYDCSLDHDMGNGYPNGTDIVRWMVETGNWPKKKPNVHSDNPYGAERMRSLIEKFWAQPAQGPMF